MTAVDLWDAVDRLVDRAPTLADLRVHRLHLLALRRWRSTGAPVPPSLQDEERAMAVSTLATPSVLERAAAALCEPAVPRP
jgi:hypothetical protein